MDGLTREQGVDQDGLRCVDNVVLGQRTVGQADPSAGVQISGGGREREMHRDQTGLSVGHILHCVRMSCRGHR